MFSSSGIWYQAQTYIADQASTALHSLEITLHRLGGLKPDMAFRIFDCKILPILLYASGIWGTHSSPDIEKVHHKFCKFILGVSSKTSNIAALGELGRYPIRPYI